MSVYKRDGQSLYSYDFRYRGRRFSGSTGCATKRDAERFENDLRQSIKAKRFDASAPLSFTAAAARYWNEKGQHHANSDDTLRSLDWLEREIGGAARLADISDSTVARLVAKRRGERIPDQRKRKRIRRDMPFVGPSTVNRTVTQPLRQILHRARKVWKQTVQDIEWAEHLLKEPQERVREASTQEEMALRASIRPDYEPALRFALLTGCRRQEIVGLEWSKVDFFNREFTVTGKRERSRTIPMTNEVFALLWAQKDRHPISVFTREVRRIKGRERVGDRLPITMEGFKTEWRRSRAKSGVEGFKFHDTRHTAATRLVRATGNIKQAQRLLGHTDIATTSRYAHVTMDDLRAGLEAATPTETPQTTYPKYGKPKKSRGRERRNT